MPEPGKCGGQYLIVAGGTLMADGTVLDRLSTVYVTPEEAAFTAKAGPDGVDLLVLQFPRMGEALAGGGSRV